MKGTINKGIANPHTQHQRMANPLERCIINPPDYLEMISFIKYKLVVP